MSSSSSLRLSDRQAEAVESRARALLVVAGAGSGKTEVVARRIERLMLEAPSEHFRVLGLSYTVKAANELGDRLQSTLGGQAARVETNTIHGFAHGLLRQHGTRIGLPLEPELLTRDEDRIELLRMWLADEGRPLPHDFAALFRELDLARSRKERSEFAAEWDRALNASGALDYASLLERAAEVAEMPATRHQLKRIYRHLVVDEAQNLTPAQFSLIAAVLGDPDQPTMDSVLVGDDKQSIVGFAGADPELMNTYARRFGADRIELDRNFRSARKIVEVGRAVAAALDKGRSDDDRFFAAEGIVATAVTPHERAEAENVGRWIETLLSDGIPPAALAPGESANVRPRDIAVLARSAAALRSVEHFLLHAGIDFVSASSQEDWLSTRAGRVALELVALHAAPRHRSTHWELRRLLGLAENDDGPIDLSEIAAAHDDPAIRELAPLVESTDLASYFSALASIQMPTSVGDDELAGWADDSRLLQEAWRAFGARTPVAEQTWGNFRIFVARQQRGGDDTEPGVRLLTIHKAQGREFRAVAVVGLNEGQLPDFRATADVDRLAELRTFYVAVTRPSRFLLLSRAQSRQTSYGPRATQPSSFLKLVDDSQL